MMSWTHRSKWINECGPARAGLGARLIAIAALTLLATSGCASSSAGPGPGPDLRIRLAVMGGIAGVDWQVTIDGQTGRVTGDSCRGSLGCDWEPGETLATVSAGSVEELADEFQRHGFFEGESEFGTECCDQFDFRLFFGENDFDRTVTGSSGRLPQNILDLIALVQEFVAEARA